MQVKSELFITNQDHEKLGQQFRHSCLNFRNFQALVCIVKSRALYPRQPTDKRIHKVNSIVSKSKLIK